ncbi:chemotaxis response regulator protein-glutamate methylesterase [Paenibacillus yanchengensis]|uniref:Protein-glutamate methylesterase/protein-glutamine glutaminase n=1 Tax=Paenibacillus yanchengensis TaxID=2035833 RepID=A0ABW4YM43_9BACL
MTPYRILVVDDSAFMRKIISDLIMRDSEFEVIGVAVNGLEAVEAVKQLKPDAVTLDLEMPVMNGIDALQQIMKEYPIPIIMLSGISEHNTQETIKALQHGAFDFIRKPTVGNLSQHITEVGELLLEKLKFAVTAKKTLLIDKITKPDNMDRIIPENKSKPHNRKVVMENKLKDTKKDDLSTINRSSSKIDPRLAKADNATKLAKEKIRQVSTVVTHLPKKRLSDQTFEHIVVIGASTGGPRALHAVITELPANFPAPILVVQHMPPRFTKSLAERLDHFSKIQVTEAVHNQVVEAGCCYVAPGGQHMELIKEHNEFRIQLSQTPHRNGHRPSVDVLFESVVPFQQLKRHSVLLTGMGSDGARGMKQLLDNGAVSSIAESEETCIVFGMPRAAIELGAATTITPLTNVAQYLQSVIM